MRNNVVALALSAIAGEIVNLWVRSQVLDRWVWAFMATSLLVSYFAADAEKKEYLRLVLFYKYKAGCLKWSYENMKKYVSQHKIYELIDLEQRIENELRVIDVKMQLKAESLGLDKDEFGE